MKSFYNDVTDAAFLTAVKRSYSGKKANTRLALALILVFSGNMAMTQSFTSQPSTDFPVHATTTVRHVVADFDKDGDADILYQTGAAGSTFRYSRNDGLNNFTDMDQASSPFAGLTLPDVGSSLLYRTADFDADGDIDIWVPSATNGNTGNYFRNDGATFSAQSSATFPTTTVGTTVRHVVADFDKDGDADILYQTGASGSSFSYAQNNGNGTFAAHVPQTSSPFAGLTLPDVTSVGIYRTADFDGDGDIDIWVPSATNGNTGSYFRNDGATFSSQSSATFPTTTASTTVRHVVADFDADGDADILYQTGASGTSFSYARSLGNGTFAAHVAQASSPFAGLTLPDVTAVGLYRVDDFDKDKDVDIWVPGTNSTGSFFVQAGSPPTVVSTSPANNANGVLVTANIVLNFSEIVNKNVGTIYIRKVSDNSLHMAIDVTSAMVTGGGTSTITINPSWDLEQLTQYYVTIDPETFADAGGAIYAGINNSTTLRFTTTTPLPAQWNSVNASAVNGKIKVDWSTTNESNASRYEVERSVNGVSFTTIGSVAANNTPGDHQYSFEDASVTKGSTYFYRVKLVDIDGKQSRSAVVSAAISGGIKQGLMIHGNPRGGALQATIFAVRAQKASVRMISTSGQVLAQQDVSLLEGENRIKLPGSGLPAGTYVLQVTTTEGVMQQKVLKQ
jgi:hypothetical protein